MNKLSSDTARIISSLQVITKVENVVKELVENSLDAGATSIEVKFENYGLAKIEVRDNGHGIKQSDIEYVAQRHYTSKISCKEDLNQLRTYGFRGEAMSSLCDVAEVFITTRTKQDTFSTKYSLNHKGCITATKPCHLVQGTTITANNLFANMPVRCQVYQTPNKRKQILKNTEDVLMSFALIHSHKRFSFMHNKCMVWQKPNCKDLQSTLENVIGSSIVSQMIRVNHMNEKNGIELTAFIPTSLATRHYRKTNDRCFIYVNKRPIRDKEIEKVIKQHTGSNSSNISMKWPVFFLDIKLPLDRVDSNVESDKSRVLISDKDLVITAVNQMLAEAYSTISNCDKENEIQDVESQLKDTINIDEEILTSNHKSIERLAEDASLILNDQTKGSLPTAPLLQSPVASDWSRGHGVVDEDGTDIQPVRILAGCQGRPTIIDRNLEDGEDGSLVNAAARLVNKMSSLGEESHSNSLKSHEKAVKMKQSNLNMSGFRAFTSTPSPLRTPTSSKTNSYSPKNLTTRKRKAPDSPLNNIHNSSLITQWASEDGNKNSKTLNCTGDNEAQYLEGQEIDVKFDFAAIKENLSFKEDYRFAEQESYSSIGTLKDIKAGVLLDNTNHRLLLVNLLRLQETKVYWSLMENHTLQRKELSHPILLPLSSLSNEELSGFRKIKFSTPDLMNPDVKCIDDRICKNGFKIKILPELDGTESLHIYEIASVSYYGINDLKNIFKKIGTVSVEASLHEARPYKVEQYLQSEAVRMTHSLPVHTSVLESLDDLKKHYSEDFLTWNCFHKKPIFHNIFTLTN